MARETSSPISVDESHRPVDPWPPHLRRALLETVDRQLGLGRPISTRLVAVHPQTAFPTFRATLRFRDGVEGAWFVKDLGHRARWAPDPVRHKRCEVGVYRDLLSGAGLETPGLLLDTRGAGGSHWLVLEFVEGTPLKWLDFEWWVASVRWLGRKDAHFQTRQQALGEQPSLNRLDESNFRTIAEEAREGVRTGAPSMSRRLESVLEYHDEIVPDLVWGEWTLVHGSYRPAQIVVQTTREPVRICPVDWETAGHGSSVCDVASLCEGFEGERLATLVKAYRDSALEHGAAGPRADDLHRTMHAHWIHRQLKLIVKSFHRGWAPEHVDRFIEAAELRSTHHRRLRALARHGDPGALRLSEQSP